MSSTRSWVRAWVGCGWGAGRVCKCVCVGEGDTTYTTHMWCRNCCHSPMLLLPAAAGKRVEGEATGEATARILSTFLTEMDGLELAQGVLVLGATNRPQALDAALVR